MSPTKQASHGCRMFRFGFKAVVRALRIISPAAIILALACTAPGAAVTWTGASSLLWATPGNWSGGPPTPPDSSGDVNFTNATAVTGTSTTNEVGADITVKSLAYSQAGSSGTVYHTTQIDSLKTLKVVGYSDAGPTSIANGNISFYAYYTPSSASVVDDTVITGGGTLDVSSSSGGNTGGDIFVTTNYNDAAHPAGVLDLSGLSSFNANVDQMLIGYTIGSSRRPLGVMYLAQTNTITLNNTTGLSSNNRNAGLVIGYVTGDVNNSTSYLYLGQTNTMNVQDVIVGGQRQRGEMCFNPGFSNSNLVMRGPAAADPVHPDPNARVSTISIGDLSDAGDVDNRAIGAMNLTGGTVDIKVNTIYLGKTASGRASYANGVTGSLSFSAGTIDATSILCGDQTATNNHNSQGTISVSGTGNLVIGTPGLTLGKFTGTNGSANASGTLNLSNSAIVSSTLADIVDGGGNSVISMSGSSVLNMGTGSVTHNIGSNPNPIDSFTISGSPVINNLGALAVAKLYVKSTYSLATTSGTTITPGGSIDLRNGSANTFGTGSLTLNGSSTMYFELSDSTTGANDQINLSSIAFNSGTLSVNVSPLVGNFSNGTYALMKFTSQSGTAPTFAISDSSRNSYPPTPLAINSSVGGGWELDISGITAGTPHGLTWNGGTAGNWDLKNSTNWLWTSGTGSTGGADQYYNLDNVTFGAATGATTVTLSNSAGAGMVPGSVTVSSDQDYTLKGSASTDKISGSTGLTKTGSGTLTISLTNDFTGTVHINGGKVIQGNSNALGNYTAPIYINGGTLDLNNQQLGSSNRSVYIQGSGLGDIGAIVNNATAAPGSNQYDIQTLILTGDATIGGASATNSTYSGLPGSNVGLWKLQGPFGASTLGSQGGAWSLTKVGNNMVWFMNTATNSSFLNVNINQGILGLDGTTTLGDPSGTITVDGSSGGAMLWLNNVSTALNKNVVLTGGNAFIHARGNGATTDNTISGTVSIADSGGIMDTGSVQSGGYSASSSAQLTISGVLQNVAGGHNTAILTKSGPGTLNVTNSANTFSGMTNLTAGTLINTGALPGGLTMSTGTTMIGTGSFGGTVTNASGTNISPGTTANTGNVGTLNMNNLTLVDGGQINYDLATTSGSDLISLSGTLSLSGTTNINIPNINSLATDIYTLITCAGQSGTGGFSPLNVPLNTRRTFLIDNTSSSTHVYLKLIGSAGNLTWVGDASSNSWDITNLSNKIWTGNEPDNFFYNFDNVTFNDSSSNNTVDIAPDSGKGYVTPSSITVTNNTKNYTFSGSKITGITGLSKDGTGTLILDNAGSDFSGAITIANGVVQVGDGPLGNYGSLGTGAMSNNGQLLFYQNGSTTTTLANAISGTGSLEQRGTNTLVVSGSNSYSGITTISNGTLQAGSNTALGSTAGGTTISNGATLDISNRSLGSEAITVQGAGVNSAGAIVNTNMVTSTTPQQALRFITLTGDTTFGGQSGGGAANSGRWDIYGTTATASTLSTSGPSGHEYTLTKVGNNQVSLVRTTVDTGLGSVNINQGVLELEYNSTLGSSSALYPVTVDGSLGPSPTSSYQTLDTGTLQFYNLSTALNKNIVLQNNGALYAKSNSLSSDNTVSGTVYVADSGGVLNAGGIRTDISSAIASTTMTLNGPIQNVAGGTSAANLYKLGAGKVILNGANTFNGTLNLNEGTVVINNSWAGPIIIGSSSTTTPTLAGIGTISSAVNDNSNTNIVPGANTNTGSVGVLTFAGGLTLGQFGAGAITLDLSNDPDLSRSTGVNDLINVTGGGLTLNGTTNVTINLVGGYLQGSSGGTRYQLIRYNSLTDNFSSWGSPTTTPINTRQIYTVVNNPATNSIDLVVTGNVGNLTWVGGANSNTWDTKSTANWNNPGPPAVNPDVFYNTDMVTFDNSSANTAVNIASGGVYPGTITVNNDTSHNYTFAGGPINGGTTLTKSGSGSLSLNSSNSYTGATAINGGKIILGNAAALGSSTAALTIADGATLDLNVQQLYAKPITVQGAGVGNNGAIVNNNTANAPAPTQYDVSNVTLTNNTTIGGTSTTITANSGLPGSLLIGRWSLRAQTGNATLSTGGNPFTLTKVGNNQIMLVSANVDTALGSVNVNEGVLSLEGTTTLGNAGTVTVDGTALGQNSGGSILQLRSLTTALTKNVTLQHGGQLYALLNTASTDNTVSGTVSLGTGGGQFNAGGLRDDYAANPLAIMTISGNIGGGGGLTCPGPGTVFITSPTVNYSGNTTVNSGTLQINSIAGSTVALHAVSGSGTLGIGDGTAMPSVTADSVSVGTLTIGAGATLTIKAIPGGPTAGSAGISPVPEPATWAMLMLAAMGLGIYWRRSR